MKYYLVLLVCLFANVQMFCANVVVYRSGEPLNVASEISVLEDYDNVLHFDDVFLRGDTLPFKQNKRKELYLGYTNATYWLHFAIVNSENSDKNLLVEFDNPSIDHLKFYTVRDSLVTASNSVGDRYPFHNRTITSKSLTFDVFIESGERIDCYVEIKPHGDANVVPVIVQDSVEFLKKETRRSVSTGLFVGVVLTIVLATLYSLLTGFFSKEYYYFLCFSLVCTFFVLNFLGTNFHYFWSDQPGFNYYINAVLPHLICFFLLQFTLLFYSLEKDYNELFIWARRGTYFILALSLVQFFPISYLVQVSISLGIILSTVLFCVSVSIVVLQKRMREAVFFIIAFIPFLFTNLYLTVLASAGIFEFQYTDTVMKGGLALQLLILYMGVFDKLKREREDAERLINLNKERYKCLLENSSDAVFVLKNTTIVFKNERFDQIIDSNSLATVEGVFHALLHEDSRVDFSVKIGECLNTRKVSDKFQVMSSGGAFFELSVVFLEWEGVPSCQCFMTDITVQKREEQKNELLEKQLQASKQMESIGTLAGGIAHDFNNILTPIIGYSEMALDEIDKTDPLHDDLINIASSANRAKDLVKQILDFSQQLDVEKETVSVKECVAEVESMLRVNLSKRIVLTVTNSFADAFVNINKAQLLQVLMNVCVNALQAMQEEGGCLTIDVDQQKNDQLQALPQSNSVRIRITDTGPGMTDSVKERLFEPFYTTKREKKGTGLGLSVVYGIVVQNGGLLHVESKLGEGSSFYVFLPTVCEGCTAEIVTVKKDDVIGGKGTVLLVDDENEITYMLSRQLQKLGYSVVEKNSSVNALQEFTADPFCYDVAIVDLTMPYMTGFELVKSFSEKNPSLPIVLMSGYFHGLLPEKSELPVNCRLIDKPIDIKKLSLLLNTLLAPPKGITPKESSC